MLTNLKYCLLAAVVILGPVGLRILTWQDPPAPKYSQDDIAEGKELFTHVWKVNDPLCPDGDGLGPVFNARSCVACHKQGGIGGGGDNRHNVTTYVLQKSNGETDAGVLHSYASRTEYLETLARFGGNLPNTSRPTLEMVREKARQTVGSNVLHLSQRNTPALFGAHAIDTISERAILAEMRLQQLTWGLTDNQSERLPVGRAFRLPNGRIGKFGWKAQSASLSDFVQAACANELGLGNPNQAQPVPMAFRNYRTSGIDLTQTQCDQITAYCASLPQPLELLHANGKIRADIIAGKKLFHSIGCANCHKPDMGSVTGIYSDLLLHRMGVDLVGGGSYNDPVLPVLPDDPSPGNDGSPLPDEWRTPPLWGVADSAPYMHDGRANTLADAIHMHGGQGGTSAANFAGLSKEDQDRLLAFLNSLKAPTVDSVVRR